MRLRALTHGSPAGILVAVVALILTPGRSEAQGLVYYPLTPCRVVDTRCEPGAATEFCPLLAAPNGLPAMVGNGVPRSFMMRGNCGVPTSATAVSLNATVVPLTAVPGNFFLTLWPSGGSMPVVSTLNFTESDTAIANGAIVPISTATNDITAFTATFDTAHLILDITGYFAP